MKPSGWSFYVPPDLAFSNSALCSHCVCVFRVDIGMNCNFYLVQHQLIGFL